MSQDKNNQSSNNGVDTQQILSQPAHSLSYDEVLRQLATHPDEGLTNAEAKKRHEQYGDNLLEGGEGVSIAKIVIRQIANAMMLVSPRVYPGVHLMVLANTL